jgi:molybdopterin-guanine dinucleotide biosynthesis protein A
VGKEVMMATLNPPVPAISRASITAVVLAGGRGARMGGVDKGLQDFGGMPLAQWALQRLHPQVGTRMLNANRNLETYARLGVPVWPDRPDLGDYAGPLAGLLTALEHCQTPFLLTVPCDSPLFPLDLAARMARALVENGAAIAMASGLETDGQLRPQPVFCLLRTDLRQSLNDYLQNGGRKVDAWAAQHDPALVAFDQPGDDPNSFFNVNTLAELALLQSGLAPTANPHRNR